MIVGAGLKALAAGFVLSGKVRVALGLCADPSGWRRMVGIGLREEASKFALPAFALKVPDAPELGDDFNARVVKALFVFLQGEPGARYRLEHTSWVTMRHAVPHVDLLVQRFAPDGSIEWIEPHLAPDLPDTTLEAHRDRARLAILSAYNRTRHLPEPVRPGALFADVRDYTNGESQAYALRLLNAVCVSFAPMPTGSERFALVARDRPSFGGGFLSFVLRPDAVLGTADVWSVVHHVGQDGAPWQEAMSRLERAWGAKPLLFPEAGTVIGPHPCSRPGERAIDETVSFHDFAPLLALRKKLNARLAPQIGADLTFGCLLGWRLAQEPEFAGLKFATTLDVPASGGHERDVDFVALRPADFEHTDAGLVAFAKRFNEVLAIARARGGSLRQIYKDSELLPAWLHRKVLEHSRERLRAELGDVGVSVVRDAKVVIGTMPDIGFDRGFLAVGNLALPTASGVPVGAVSAKAPKGTGEAYPAAIARALARCPGE